MTSNTERLVFLVSVTVLGLAFSLVLEPPALWLLAAVLVILVCVGTDFVIHGHSRVQIRRKRYAVSLWALPSMVVVAALLFLRLPLFANGMAVIAGLAVAALLLALVIVGEYHTIDPQDPLYPSARLLLNAVAYLTAFALLTAVYGTKARSLMTATTITLGSALIALEVLRGVESRVGRHWLYAATCGLAMGEITWALNYWSIPPLAGGVFLLLCFYAATGAIQAHISGSLTPRIAAEFAVVGVLGLLLVFASMTVRQWQ